jgi:hypothetical protein
MCVWNDIKKVAAVGAVVAVVLAAAPTLLADRPTDKDVKGLIDRINSERDRFEDQLDGKIKSSIIRGPNGEVHVERYLDDLQDNVGKLKERYKGDYAASAEATTVLRQASEIQRFMATQPPNFDGFSEWSRLASSLGELAAAYGTSMPLPEGMQARRMNDREVKTAAEAVAKSADRFKKDLDTSLKADTTVPPATREAAVQAADGLKKDANTLASLVGDGRPASGEAKALLDRAAAIRTAASGRPLAPAPLAAWKEVESGLVQVGLAFGVPAK